MPFFARVTLALVILYLPVFAQFTLQHDLTSASGAVALSADGNTAIVGEWTGTGLGGVLIFTRTGGNWSQQGPELTGTPTQAIHDMAGQGMAVAISADGSTAAVGGPYDSSNGSFFHGAAWVFTRSGGVWSQQSGLLTGMAGGPGNTFEGGALALSADGNTLLMGSATDGVYVFTRSNGRWNPNGVQLPGSGNCPGSVALSADGKTALLGCAGSPLAFIQSGGQWTVQGPVGPTGAGALALSADGNTALLGEPGYNNKQGAAAVFTRSNGVWTQQGGLLTVSDVTGTMPAQFGASGALSGDGNTAMITGPGDNNGMGATWVFTRSNGVWTEKSKIANAFSAAISADSSTALVIENPPVVQKAETILYEASVYVQPSYLTMTHPGNLTQGQTGVPITISAGAEMPGSGGASVTAMLPAAYTATAIAGPGWSCSLGSLTCTRSDSLAPGASYPPITVTVNVNPSAPSQQTSVASVSAGSSPAAVTTDTATILPPFTDVSPTDTFLPAIDLLRSYAITSGCGPTAYCPGDNITRGQMAVFVVRSVMGGDSFTYSGAPYFNDVQPGDAYFPWIQKMYELGITGGCAPSTYCPNDPVTRGQLAVFIVRARYGASTAFTYPATPQFTDVSSGSSYFSWVQKMQQVGITSGCGVGTYCPDDSVTRGQMAVFLMRGGFNQFLPAGSPVVVWSSPATGSPGQTVTVEIAGQNTNFSPGVTTIGAGPGITVGNIAVGSGTSLTAQLTIGAGAALGPRSIIVTTGSEEAVLPNGFRVQ